LDDFSVRINLQIRKEKELSDLIKLLPDEDLNSRKKIATEVFVNIA